MKETNWMLNVILLLFGLGLILSACLFTEQRKRIDRIENTLTNLVR